MGERRIEPRAQRRRNTVLSAVAMTAAMPHMGGLFGWRSPGGLLPPRLRGGRGGVRERTEPKKEPYPALPEGGEGKRALSAAYAAFFHSQAATSRAPRSGHSGAARKA